MKAALFDVDGTLLDSMWVWNNLAGDYLLSVGEKPTKDLNEVLKSLSLNEGIKYLKESFNLKDSIHEIDKKMKCILYSYYRDKLQLKPGVMDVLKGLRENRVTMGIISASDEQAITMALKRHGIRDYFRFIQTPQNTGLGKVEPVFFKKAIDRLGLRPEQIWVFEDALHSIIAAKKCGLKVVGVRDDSALDDEIKIRKVSDIYIDNFSQLEVNKLWKKC